MDGRTDEQRAAKAAFLAALKEQAQRDGWARVVYEPEARTYEARRYADGVLCRRLDELKPGDRVVYLRNSTGERIEGKIAEVTTMPEHHAEAGKPAYRLHFDKEAAERVGHPVTIPHGRVALVWPESAHESNCVFGCYPSPADSAEPKLLLRVTWKFPDTPTVVE